MNPKLRPIWIATAVLVLMAGFAGSAGADGDEPRKPRDTLRWTTQSELELFGFDVYRSVAKTGPFRLVTERPISAAGTSDVPSRYSFADASPLPGQAYWYYVERISMDGKRSQFTPIVFVPARPPVKPASPGPDSEPGNRRP